MMQLLNVLGLLEVTQGFEQKINLALRYAGLRLPLFKAMNILQSSGKITVSDLSRQMRVTRATVSVLVNELKRANIIETIDNSADKRSFYIQLTESGVNRLELARQEVAIVVKKLSSHFDAQTVAAINAFAGMIKYKQ